MDRRKFVRLATATAAAGSFTDSFLPSQMASAFVAENNLNAPRKALMRVGHQHESS
ncbi:MAG: hypothetical protein QOJ12_3651, partial [Thermoleophilales bacterium]|nr:hypothetical protein [Thermoleophilales bacterium]